MYLGWGISIWDIQFIYWTATHQRKQLVMGRKVAGTCSLLASCVEWLFACYIRSSFSLVIWKFRYFFEFLVTLLDMLISKGIKIKFLKSNLSYHRVHVCVMLNFILTNCFKWRFSSSFSFFYFRYSVLDNSILIIHLSLIMLFSESSYHPLNHIRVSYMRVEFCVILR